jgi:wyosine [tRNA(Phe)-imidazoG37] synthetase (radical SAM superfamily)
VDPVPFKTCNYSCVYCQLGRTTPFTAARQDFFPPEEILSAVEARLATCRSDELDYVTFVGQGEPLLCASLGRLIRGVKSLTAVPVAVITNGSLIFMPEVREDLSAADVVIPTLDAADEATFRRINRPWTRLKVADIVSGLASFRESFAGQLWVEVMLVRGLNDTAPALLELAKAVRGIRPDRVHINLPTRPPAEAWVEGPDEQGLVRAMAILGEVATIVTPSEGEFVLRSGTPPVDAVVDVLRRHPMRHEELERTLERVVPGEVEATLLELAGCDRVARRTYRGQTFWTFAAGSYGTTARKPSRDRTGGTRE